MLEIHKILTLATLAELSPAVGLDAIAQLVDYAFDHKNEALTTKSLYWCEEIEPRLVSEIQRIDLDYYQANAWANRQSERQHNRAEIWAWEQEELQKQIFFLRRAIQSPAFSIAPVRRKCEILTNLANQLDTAGRFIEARELWSNALQEYPAFWMARGNRARGLWHYAQSLHDTREIEIFALEAHNELLATAQDIKEQPQLGDPSVLQHFLTITNKIEHSFDLQAIKAEFTSAQFPLPKSDSERGYRIWCLNKVLFLNSLNDLHTHPIAATDNLTLPDFITSTDEPPVLVGFFNQLKQEYVSARWLYFEGINANEIHPSDRDVLLYNTLDYASLGLGIEKVKISFRMSYSLLDKIAYFLNHYMKLGIPETEINFRSIWYEKGNNKKIRIVRSEFSNSENWPFRGLYWLNKDLFSSTFKDVTDPDARNLHELRNHLEHKYVKVHAIGPRLPMQGMPTDLFFDSFAHSVSCDDLERRTLRILKLARSALIYLSLGMHKEENRRRVNAGPDVLIGSIALTKLEDERKCKW